MNENWTDIGKTILWICIIALVLVGVRAFAGPLPDPSLTPGVARDLTLEQVCTTQWGKDKRLVSSKMKQQVFARYGYTGNDDPRCIPDPHGRKCEIDHDISRELAGADDLDNLWPQSYGGPCNATHKDHLENVLHAKVCAGELGLAEAQDAIRTNWIEAFSRYVDEKGCE